MTDPTNPLDPTQVVPPGADAPTLDVGPSTPEVPDIPVNQFGYPSWVVWCGRQIVDRGVSRYVGFERNPDLAETSLIRTALANLVADGIGISEARPDRVETRQGIETINRVAKRPGTVNDVVGVIYYQATIQGVPLSAESHRLSVLMYDGRKYLCGGDGQCTRCVFGNEGFSPLSTDARGDFHEKCFNSEREAHRREKESERDVVFARSRLAKRA